MSHLNTEKRHLLYHIPPKGGGYKLLAKGMPLTPIEVGKCFKLGSFKSKKFISTKRVNTLLMQDSCVCWFQTEDGLFLLEQEGL